jgi:hypothetical protein
MFILLGSSDINLAMCPVYGLNSRPELSVNLADCKGLIKKTRKVGWRYAYSIPQCVPHAPETGSGTKPSVGYLR